MAAPRTYAGDELQVWPIITESEQFRDNLPLAVTNTSFALPPPLWPIPPLPSPIPVNTKPPPKAPAPPPGTSWDLLSIASFDLSAALTGNRRTLELDYTTDAQLYPRNSQLNEAFQDQYIGFTDQERISQRTSLWVGNTFIKGQSVFGQGLIGSSGTTPFLSQGLLQSSFITNTFDANLNHQMGEHLGFNLATHQTLYSTSGGSASQSFYQGGTVSFPYALNPRISVGPSAEYEDFRFSNQPRSESFQPSGSLTWRPDPAWVIKALVGPLMRNSPTGTKLDFGYTLTASYLRERWQLSLESARTPTLSAGFSGAGVNQFSGAAAIYQMDQFTSAYANAGYSTVSGQWVMTADAGINHHLTTSLSIFSQFLWFRTNSSGFSSNSTDVLTFGVRFAPEPWMFRL